jgi:tetratricopeptide (TPR) repeat protein
MWDPAGALELLQQALKAPVSSGAVETHTSRSAKSFEEDLTEKLIDQQLARVYLEQDQFEKAVQAAHSADTSRPDLVPHLRQEQYIIEARLALRRGQFDKAFSLLEESLDRRLKEQKHVIYNDQNPFVKVPKPRTTEAYVILAAAARKSGHSEQYEKAARLARRHGADLSLLQ